MARHRAPEPGKTIAVGKCVGEWVYELFITTLDADGFLVEDVLDLYHGRGAFEAVLADEDIEEDPDRWCSYTECGQERWQIACQWVWNLRLELGQHLSPTPIRTTEFAPAIEPAPVTEPAPMEYGPPQWARHSFTGGFPGSAFRPQPDGTLLCPACHPLYPQERRPERGGAYRLVYTARIGDCRHCELRAKCQESLSTLKPRQVSAVLWPLTASQAVPSAPILGPPEPVPLPSPALGRFPVLWKDWPAATFGGIGCKWYDPKPWCWQWLRRKNKPRYSTNR